MHVEELCLSFTDMDSDQCLPRGRETVKRGKPLSLATIPMVLKRAQNQNMNKNRSRDSAEAETSSEKIAATKITSTKYLCLKAKYI